MNFDSIEINWNQIKGEVKTQWVKLASKGNGMLTGISDKPAKNASEFCGPTEDGVKEMDEDIEKH